MTDLAQKIIGIISVVATLPADQISVASNLSDLNVESLDRVEIAIELESEFGVQISDRDAAQFSTVGDIVRHVEKMATETAR